MGKPRVAAQRAAAASNKTVNYVMLGGALATLTVYMLGLLDADVTPEVGAALTTVYTTVLRIILK